MNKLVIIAVVGTLLAGSFGGAWAAATITGADIVDGSIGGVDIGNKQVGLNNLATDSVDGSKIKNLSIRTGDLGDGIVTSGKIKDGTIQKVDIAKGILPSGADNIIYGSCGITIEATAKGKGGGTCPVDGVKDGDEVVATLNHAFDYSVVLISAQSSEDCEAEEPSETCWIQFQYVNLEDTDVEFPAKFDFVVWR